MVQMLKPDERKAPRQRTSKERLAFVESTGYLKYQSLIATDVSLK